MAAASLARAARRLSQGATRGLSDALADAGPASTAGRQWALTSLRAHSAAGAGSGSDGASSSGGGMQPPSAGTAPELGLKEAGRQPTSSSSTASAQAEAAAAAAAALRQRPPPGHTDFEQRQLLMLFTCSKCNTRAAKAFSKQSYEQGVVIVECPGCSSRHLIADHLGWFGQKGTVEQFAAERGSTVMRRLADGTVELTPEDLLGHSLAAEAAVALGGQQAEGGGGGGVGGGGGGGEGAAAVQG